MPEKPRTWMLMGYEVQAEIAEKQRAYREQNKAEIAEKKRARENQICSDCGETMRHPSETGLCGFCEQGLAA